MTRRALITGITGMVGSHLADYLYKKHRLAYCWHGEMAQSFG